MNENEYVLLRNHLYSLDAGIMSFCQDYNFSEQLTGIGRYPRRRLVQYGEVNFYFDLQMDLTKNGKRYEQFYSEIPYSLGMGAWLDIEDDRLSHNKWCFQGRPFSEFKNRIRDELEIYYAQVDTWTVDWLRKEGQRSIVSKV